MADSSQIEPDLDTYSTGFTRGAFGHIPLTTIFTPPPSCLSTVTYDGTFFWQGGIVQTGDQDCYPPRFTDIFNSQYSPGICPHGWTSVANLNTAGPITQSDGEPASLAFCCPSGYYHSSTNVGFLQHACASLFGSPLTNVYSTYARAEGPIPQKPKLITVDPNSVDKNTVYADIIQIQWAATDTEVLRLMSQTTSSSSSQVQSTSAQTAHRTIPNVAQTATPTATPLPTATPIPSSSGLSTGAKAGIGIGAAIGAVALVLLAYFLWRRQRRQKGDVTNDKESGPRQHQGYRAAHELHPQKEKTLPQAPVELPSERAQELPATEGRSELESDTTTTRYSTFSGTTNAASSRNPS
ncbi:MAG: hypothetical protein Q9170_006285 [Blastenia crenularia]